MHRFRVPELALGALFTIAVFSLGSAVQIFRSTGGGAGGEAVNASKNSLEAETNERIANYNLALDWLTGVLAVSTIALWWVTWRSGVRQSRDMAAAIAAAQASNEISQTHMIADQRAWLTVKLDIITNLVIDHRGCTFDVSARIMNIGKTPALNAHTAMMLTLNHRGAAQVLAEFSRESGITTPPWSRVVLPAEFYDRPWKLNVDKAEIDKFKAKDHILPIVVGCVTYQILPDRSVHQTKFMYHLVMQGGPLGELVPAQAAVIEKAHLLCRTHAGGDAD